MRGVIPRLSVSAFIIFVAVASAGCKSDKSGDLARPAPPSGGSPPHTSAQFQPLESAVPVLLDRPLLVALRWTGGADAPTWLDARTDEGATIRLPVGLLEIRPRRSDSRGTMRFDHWRWAEGAFDFSESSDAQKSAGIVASYWLILENPEHWPGSGLHVGADRITLIPITADPHEPPSGPIEPTNGFDRPGAIAPTESVRRALWRRRSNPNAPVAANDHGSLSALLGRQSVGRWCSALRDLTALDPGLAADLEGLLVRTAWDGPTCFAAWPAAADQLAELESLLLARLTGEVQDEDWRLSLHSWLARQPDFAVWVETESGDTMRLAAASLASERRRLAAAFADRAGEVTRFDLVPWSVSRHVMVRPKDAPSSRLIVQVGAASRSLPILDSSIVVLPPGRLLEVPWRHWTLDAWLRGQPESADPAEGTTLLVQRSPHTRQWEMVVTCRWRRAPVLRSSEEGHPLKELANWRQAVGHESITVLLGPPEHPDVAATILPDGSVHDWARSALIRSENVRVVVKPDRWQATIALREGLIADAVLEVGLLRMHDGVDMVDCLPRPALPWRCDPGRLRLDLSRWEALPVPEDERPAPASPDAGAGGE